MAQPSVTPPLRRCLVFLGAALLAGSIAAQTPRVASLPAPTPAGPVPYPMPPELVGVNLNAQSDAEVAAKSDNCTRCHQGARDPHFKDTVHLGCTDCHGCGNGTGSGRGHGCPMEPPSRNPHVWRSSANPI